MSAVTNNRKRPLSATEGVYMEGYTFDNSVPRSGKWTVEEEAFANRLISEFESGSLGDCEDGCTLRSYLARKLNCAPMRISKKFAGQCIGKHAFLRKEMFPAAYGPGELGHFRQTRPPQEQEQEQGQGVEWDRGDRGEEREQGYHEEDEKRSSSGATSDYGSLGRRKAASNGLSFESFAQYQRLESDHIARAPQPVMQMPVPVGRVSGRENMSGGRDSMHLIGSMSVPRVYHNQGHALPRKDTTQPYLLSLLKSQIHSDKEYRGPYGGAVSMGPVSHGTSGSSFDSGSSGSSSSCVGLDIDDIYHCESKSIESTVDGGMCVEAAEWRDVLSFFCGNTSVSAEQTEVGMSMVRRDNSFLVKSNSYSSLLL